MCNACRFHIKKKNESSKLKKKKLKDFESAKKKNKGNYGCIIPVSGGKDGMWQVMECLNHGLTPLAVT